MATMLRAWLCARWTLVISGIACLTLPSTVYGSNGNKPRVQARWKPGQPCIETIDKATQSSLLVQYTFDGRDDIRPADSQDEVEDSRRHQFFASCRHRHRQEILPRWISRADLDRALAFGFPIVDPGPERILDSSSAWGNCALRINVDDQRLPITHAQARAGVQWDISVVPTGTYVIDAYTWEPPENLWTSPSRPGAVRVWDSRIDPAPPPAAAIDATASIGFVGQPQQIRGCVSAQPGSTSIWSIAPLPPVGVPATWTDIEGPTPAPDGTFEWSFVPPAPEPGLGLKKWMLRLTVTQPDGLRYEAYNRADLLVLDEDADAEFSYEPPPETGTGCKQGATTPPFYFLIWAFFWRPKQRPNPKHISRCSPSPQGYPTQGPLGTP